MSRVIWACALASVLMASGRARAQLEAEIPASSSSPAITEPIPPTEDDPLERARALFLEGRRAMDQGRFELAIEHLRASLATASRPATAFALAIALRGAGHPTQAAAVLEELLAGLHGALRDDQRADARRLRDAAAADIASVRVRVANADGLELRIDGLRVEGVTPGTWIERRLDPGRHAITVTAHARVPAERVLVLQRGTTAELDLELAPEVRPGTLAVVGSESDLQVEIVGIARGRGQVEAEIPPGEYVVRAMGGGGATETRIEVPSGRTVRLQVSGRGASLAEDPWFWVVLAGSVLAVGGAAAGVGLGLDPLLSEPVADPVFGVTVTLTTP